eukprot:692304-Pelagomonas_calceolata.AAC.2
MLHLAASHQSAPTLPTHEPAPLPARLPQCPSCTTHRTCPKCGSPFTAGRPPVGRAGAAGPPCWAAGADDGAFRLRMPMPSTSVFSCSNALSWAWGMIVWYTCLESVLSMPELAYVLAHASANLLWMRAFQHACV